MMVCQILDESCNLFIFKCMHILIFGQIGRNLQIKSTFWGVTRWPAMSCIYMSSLEFLEQVSCVWERTIMQMIHNIQVTLARKQRMASGACVRAWVQILCLGMNNLFEMGIFIDMALCGKI